MSRPTISLRNFLRSLVVVLPLCCLAGCGGHGGVVEETDEMTFDQMAEMAAEEAEANESSAESGSK